MKYLLDTCLVSELVRKSPNANVVKWLAECDEDLTYLSVLTLGEIQKGISGLNDKKRKRSLQNWLDSELKSRFSGRILPISEEVAQMWGQIQGEAEAKGITIPSIDGLIGAIAVAHNLTIVTRNEKDFVSSGARILNPWT